MIEKYRELNIYEIENGFILKEVFPDNPKWINQPACVTKYFQNVDSLIEEIKEKMK